MCGRTRQPKLERAGPATRMLLRHGARGALLRDDGARHLPWTVRAAAGSVALAPAAAGFVVRASGGHTVKDRIRAVRCPHLVAGRRRVI